MFIVSILMEIVHDYSRVPLYGGPLQHDIAYSTSVTEALHKSEFVFTIDTPYLAPMGKLWGVYCDDFQ